MASGARLSVLHRLGGGKRVSMNPFCDKCNKGIQRSPFTSHFSLFTFRFLLFKCAVIRARVECSSYGPSDSDQRSFKTEVNFSNTLLAYKIPRISLVPWRRTHNASFDRILGIIVPQRGGVTGHYKPVHQSLVFPGEIIVESGEIVVPLFFGPGADNRRRDDPVI